MDSEEQTPPHNSNRLRLIIAAIVLLTILAVWLVPSDEPETADIPMPGASVTEVESIAEPVATEIVENTLQASLPSEQAPDVIETKPAIEGTLARTLIAEHVRNGTSLDTLYIKALDLDHQGKLADAYLAYFYAARKGHSAASLALAKQADPAFYSAGNSVLDAADMVQAHKWYLAAIKAGNQKAPPLLKQLHEYVRNEAINGNPVAESLLLQWD